MEGFKFSTIEEAVADLRAGKMIIAVDDPDRENEGDLICAAEHATLENVNFMASYAKGLICMPMSKALTTKLGLEQMVANNTDNHCTAFTVSIDHVDTTTGISALERSMTAMKSVKDDAKPSDFRRPGHMFPLEAKAGGVLERMGHTEATVDLMRIARLKECGLCCEIMREDGTMMRTPELKEFAVRHGLKMITVADLITYRRRTEILVERVTEAEMPTKYGIFKGTSLTANRYCAGYIPNVSPGMLSVPCVVTVASSWRKLCAGLRKKAGVYCCICVRKAGASD